LATLYPTGPLAGSQAALKNP